MNLISHIHTDKMIPKHMGLGFLGFIISMIMAAHYIDSWAMIFIVGILGGFFTGIGIEVVQRIQRIGKPQNTLQESVLDALATGCWFLYPVRYYGWWK